MPDFGDLFSKLKESGFSFSFQFGEGKTRDGPVSALWKWFKSKDEDKD